MPVSTLITDYLGAGLAADRPATPPIAADALAFYYATDTAVLSEWSGAAWLTIGSPSIRSVPIPFSFSGKPLAGQKIHIALLASVVLLFAVNFTGSAAFVGTAPTAVAVFALDLVRAGSVTAIGTVSIATTGVATFVATTAYTSIAGDTIRLSAPATQDATLSDVCITFAAARV